MSEIPEVNFDAKPPKKKKVAKKRKARATAAPRAEKSAVPFPGLTRSKCADACYAKGVCSISGSYCAHPTKGALHAVDMRDADKLKRLQQARDQLQVRIDPDRFQ